MASASDSPETTETTETTQEPVAVWLRNPRTGMVNLVLHPETIRRCLSEGHTVTSDPRLPADIPTDGASVAPHLAPESDATAAGQPPAKPEKPEKPERATRRPSAKRGA